MQSITESRNALAAPAVHGAGCNAERVVLVPVAAQNLSIFKKIEFLNVRSNEITSHGCASTLAEHCCDRVSHAHIMPSPPTLLQRDADAAAHKRR